MVLDAFVRASSGSAISKKLRATGRVPGVVFSLPGESSELLSLDAKEVGRAFSRLGRLRFPVTLFELRIRDAAAGEGEREGAPAAVEPFAASSQADPATAAAAAGYTTLRALGRQVHVRADTDAVENVTFIACPEDREVSLEVPISLFGEEVCPGLKAGGRVNRIRRTVPVRTTGGNVPIGFEVDISKLVVGDKILLSDVQLPDGVRLEIRDPTLPILKIMRR